MLYPLIFPIFYLENTIVFLITNLFDFNVDVVATDVKY